MSFREIGYKSSVRDVKRELQLNFPLFFSFVNDADTFSEFISTFRSFLEEELENYKTKDWSILSRESAIKRALVLIENEGFVFIDPNRNNQEFTSKPFFWLWKSIKNDEVYATNDFFEDMFMLFSRVFDIESGSIISKDTLLNKMKELPNGTDNEIVELRKRNKQRIVESLIPTIEENINEKSKYQFTNESTLAEKIAKVCQWWNESGFHLRFAIRTVEQLNRAMGYKLPKNIVENFERGVAKGIPIFINPYYLSLISINEDGSFNKNDRTIRDYIFYSKDLVDTFGKIKAWEKEDIIEDGKPNAAGWLLPKGDSVHRRYPEVAIFIPEGRGRACAGLCVSCQRMYGFQKGQLNFDLDKADQKIDKAEQRKSLFKYFETDSHLQDILITGGDAFMNTDKGLERIMADFLEVAVSKKNMADKMGEDDRIASFQRVRLGTRILAYLPQRVGSGLVDILKDFKAKASKIGIKQFIIQTHFETSMELTPEAVRTIEMLRETGWLIVNQQVFTTAASRRSHSMHLRRSLNKLGVLPYYTFAVKGFKENRENAAPIARVAQEVFEEKVMGKPQKDRSVEFYKNPTQNHKLFAQIEQEENLPFVATDRSLINLPALGKSLSFEQIGITLDGRRILSFEHDKYRNHSPVVKHGKKVIIVESKSIAAYLQQIATMGENVNDYYGIYSYSKGETEKRSKVFEYPEFDYKLTESYNHCEI